MIDKTDPLNKGQLGEGMAESTLRKTNHGTAGQLLKAAREAQGMDLGLLASSLKVSDAQLGHLEADRYDQLPDMAFTRNFALSVAKRLKVDTQEILQLLPSLDSQTTVDAVAKLSQDSRGSTMKDEVLGGKKGFNYWWLVFLGLLVAVFAVLFVLSNPIGSEEISSSTPITGVGNSDGSISIPIQPTVIQDPQAVNSTVGMPLVVDSTQSSTTQPAMVDQFGAAQTSAVAEVVTPANVVEPAVAPSSSETNVLVITTKTESWVSVKDSTGKSLASQTLKTGSNLSFPLSNLPLTVRVGNADAVAVTIRGESFDISRNIVNGVANFKVN